MKKKNIPKKGAGRKWAERLKEIGSRKPPQEIIDRFTEKEDPNKKVARPLKKPEAEM